MKSVQPPLIYNLFPRLIGSYDRWGTHAARARAMGFNWIYLNPVTYPGCSGSLYSIKDHFRINPSFLPPTLQHRDIPLQALEPEIRRIENLGIHPMADLVINHTAIDCPLIHTHPSWYMWDGDQKIRHPFAVDPENPERKTVWGDLAEVNNRHSPDRESLWEFWSEVVLAHLRVGFQGFRCDAAYQVPVELWKFLIGRARERNPDVLFLAENLGCTLEETRNLRQAGFQLFCNSFKWWNFEDAWCLEQHQEFEDLPSISFAETHDTERLAKETGGNEALQRQRFAFAAIFSTGVMMPVGYEWGFQKQLNVVETQPSDWEAPRFDLREFILAINTLKKTIPLLQGEGALQRLPSVISEVLILERQSSSAPGERGWIVVNKESERGHRIPLGTFNGGTKMLDYYRMTSAEKNLEAFPCKDELVLHPAELLFVIERGPRAYF